MNKLFQAIISLSAPGGERAGVRCCFLLAARRVALLALYAVGSSMLNVECSLAGNVVVTLLDSQQNPLPGVKCIVSALDFPQPASGGVAVLWRTNFTTDINGQFTISNAVPSQYQVAPIGNNFTPFSFIMPATNGTIRAEGSLVYSPVPNLSTNYPTFAQGDLRWMVIGDPTILGGSVIEGLNNSASIFGHAEGMNNVADGGEAHAEGYGNTASGSESHSEGYGNSNLGTVAHAEGEGNVVTGPFSHVEGYLNTVTGSASHAGGRNASATNDNTFVWSDGTPWGSLTNNRATWYAANGFVFGGGPIWGIFTGTGSNLTGITYSQLPYVPQSASLSLTNLAGLNFAGYTAGSFTGIFTGKLTWTNGSTVMTIPCSTNLP